MDKDQIKRQCRNCRMGSYLKDLGVWWCEDSRDVTTPEEWCEEWLSDRPRVKEPRR